MLSGLLFKDMDQVEGVLFEDLRNVKSTFTALIRYFSVSGMLRIEYIYLCRCKIIVEISFT